MMATVNTQLVDQIVARVIATLAVRGDESEPPLQNQQASENVIGLNHGVITASIVEEEVGEVASIIVSEKSIVTPGAQDALRERGITWKTGSAVSRDQMKPAANSRLLIVEQATTPVWTAARKMILEPHGPTGVNAGDTKQIAEIAVKHVQQSNNAIAIIATATPHRIACELNRDEKLRAVVMCGDHGIEPDFVPNAFCLSPEGKSVMELRRMLKFVVDSQGGPS